MASSHQAQLLLNDLGEIVGIADLGFDEGGRCALLIDGALDIEVSFIEESNRLVLAALLGKLPADASRERYVTLLDANFFWQGTNGATLGVERGSGTIVMIESIPIEGLHASALESRLGTFVEDALNWGAKIAGNGNIEQGGVETGAPDDEGRGHCRLDCGTCQNEGVER